MERFGEIRIAKRSQFEWLLLAYLIVILAHSAVPYLKFILWIGLIALTTLMLMKGKVSSIGKKNGGLICMSYGLFLVWVILSKQWSYVQRPNSDIVGTMIRIFPLSLGIALYLDEENKIWRIFDLVVTAVSYFAFVFVVTSPVSTYGTTAMRGITEQHRNFSSYLCAMGAIIAIHLTYNFPYEKKKYIVCAIMCATLVVLGGSRGALFSLGVMVVVYYLFEKSLTKRIKYILLSIVLLLIAAYFVFTNEYLYRAFGSRILGIINGTDMSADDRSMYIDVGFAMWRQKPLCGWGMDNFSYYLNAFEGYGREVYSHCNYAEILSCYGLIGALLYYWPYFKTLFSQWKFRKNNPISRISIVLLIRFLIFEYSTISFQHPLYIVILTILFCSANILWNDRNRNNSNIGVL